IQKTDRHAHGHRDLAGGRRARPVGPRTGRGAQVVAEAGTAGDTVLETSPRARMRFLSQFSIMCNVLAKASSSTTLGLRLPLPPIPTSACVGSAPFSA